MLNQNQECSRTLNRRARPPLVLIGWLLGPGRGRLGGEAHVVVGAGGGLVGEVGGEQGGPVVLDDDRVVLGHVDGWGQLVVTWGLTVQRGRG